MKKKVLLIFNLVICHFLFSTGIGNYPFSDTDRDLYLTGDSYYSSSAIVYGKHQNLSISPNYFDCIGLSLDESHRVDFDPGYLGFDGNLNGAFLNSSVENPRDTFFSNYKIQGSFLVAYLFKLPTFFNNKLSLAIGPYTKFTMLQSNYSDIENIAIQSNYALNLGAKTNIEYSIFKTLRTGLNFSSFLIGFDWGRNSYNKEMVMDPTLSTPVNYMDLIFELYTEYDLTRTSSIRVYYQHNAFSVNDDNNTILSGFNGLGIGFNKKVVR